MKRWRLLAAIAIALLLGVIVALFVARSRSVQHAPVALENGKTHYGKTYPEWASAWWRWTLETPPPSSGCMLLTNDGTGENCSFGQPPDAFFLVGNQGGKVVRTKCIVPRGRPVLFPVVNFFSDGAGDAPSKQVSDERHIATMTETLGKTQGLFATVDGVAVDVAKHRVEATKWSYTLPPEPNFFSCGGLPGVTGKIDPSYHAGYWVLLAPLTPGRHAIRFGGTLHLTKGDVVIDVTYLLRVE